MKKYFYLPLLVLYGCANVVAPTGGDKDSQPPQVVAATPANESINFSGRTIQIQFDEYVQLKDAFNQVIISPPLNEAPEIKVKGKSILIDFKEELLDSTTYTIQFGESISDITEGNPLINYVYAFSTGNVIDSLTISGTVQDLVSGLPADKALIVLYNNTQDTAFQKLKPTYFTKASKSGTFEIGHIKPGKYKIYALEDQNFNYFYDLPNERISFTDSLINIESDINNLNLSIFAEDNTPLFVLDARSTEAGQSRIILSKKTDSINIEFIGDQSQIAFIQKQSPDTIVCWHPNLSKENHVLRVQAIGLDTTLTIAQKTIIDTAAFRKSTNIWENAPPEANGGRSRLPAQELNQPLRIELHRPIVAIDTSLIHMYIDSGKTEVSFRTTYDSLHFENILITTEWIMDTTYTFKALPGAFLDILNKPNDTILAQFETRHLEEYGILELQIRKPGQHFLLIELLKKDGRTVASKYTNHADTTLVKMEYLLPEVYKLRVTVDENGNGKWDTGSFSEKRQPEPIFFYPAEIKLRPNWTYEVDFNLKY